MAYSTADKQNALATLAQLQFNAYKASEILGIPRSTLIRWQHETDTATAVLVQTALDDDEREKHGMAASLSPEVRRNARTLLEKVDATLNVTIDRLKAEIENPARVHQLRDLAVSVGILTDKLLDLRDGRKGATINVDARQQSITAEAIELLKAQPDALRDAELPPGLLPEPSTGDET